MDDHDGFVLRRILVALDASPRAPDVLAAAADLARHFDAEVLLLRVVFVPPEFPPAAHVSHGDELVEHLDEVAHSSLDELCHVVHDVRIAERIVRHGQPAAVILATAKELDVDLVVIGSHGFGGWDRILGTTAARVANLADRSVLVVHGHPIGETPRILLAIDTSDRAASVIAAAAELVARYRASVHPFRALESSNDRDGAVRDLHALSASLDPAPGVVAKGRAWTEILRAAVAIDADLVVIGSHGYRGRDRILGTTAGRVVDLADRNVLVVHRP